MKSKYLILLAVMLFSCANEKRNRPAVKEMAQHQIKSSEFQSILDHAKVIGTILIYDLQENSYYSNDFEWAATGKLPASTFKIPNSIIALENEVVENDSTMFKWNGEKRELPIWEQDMIFKEAFHRSCVPCYQDVARGIGVARMNSWLQKLQYGTMQVDSATIDKFWLEGASRISANQQIDFLVRFYKNELPISSRTQAIMKRMMLIEENNRYTLYGKTGWSNNKGNHNGWFVGYMEIEKGAYFFASNIEPKGLFQQATFVPARKEVVLKALQQLKLID
ncbi:MAG: class D beta-lactamase [Flavobacteriaceae bacterium]